MVDISASTAATAGSSLVENIIPNMAAGTAMVQ